LTVTGQAYEDAVENLMAMGYEREAVVRALHASFNNPDRAADYLINVRRREGLVPWCKVKRWGRGSLPHLRKRDRVRVGALDTLSV